jgi:hypothetical protein
MHFSPFPLCPIGPVASKRTVKSLLLCPPRQTSRAENPCIAAWDVTDRYLSVNGMLKISGYIIEEYASVSEGQRRGSRGWWEAGGGGGTRTPVFPSQRCGQGARERRHAQGRSHSSTCPEPHCPLPSPPPSSRRTPSSASPTYASTRTLPRAPRSASGCRPHATPRSTSLTPSP